MFEPDRDYGDEDAYERQQARLRGYDELDEDDAYELTDPKHPRHYEAMVDAWDNRDKTERLP